MNMRARAALGLLRWAYRLEEGLAAFVDPESLLEFNRSSYPSEAAQWIKRADDGLDAAETALMERLNISSGRALCLGSGGGREAFALARLGCEVVGVEQVGEMAAFSREHARARGLSASFVEGDMTRCEVEGKFEHVFLMNLVYSLVPTRRKRVELLQRCARSLAPGGRCVLSFSVKPPTDTERKWFPISKTVAILCGNPGFEIGDRLDSTPIYFRYFPSPEVVADEAREAGFARVELFSPTANDHFAVLGARAESERISPLDGRGTLPMSALPAEFALAAAGTLTASGWSMHPAISKGDRLTVVCAPTVAQGDIVVFRQDGALICHRVKHVLPGGAVVTQGDNSATEDPAVAASDILGKVAAVGRRRRLIPARLAMPFEGIGRGLRARCIGAAGSVMRLPIARTAASALLPRFCRYYAAERAPVKLFAAYSFVELRPGEKAKRGSMLVAKLFGLTVATLEPAAGLTDAHPALKGLGIEETLARWAPSR